MMGRMTCYLGEEIRELNKEGLKGNRRRLNKWKVNRKEEIRREERKRKKEKGKGDKQERK